MRTRNHNVLCWVWSLPVLFHFTGFPYLGFGVAYAFSKYNNLGESHLATVSPCEKESCWSRWGLLCTLSARAHMFMVLILMLVLHNHSGKH